MMNHDAVMNGDDIESNSRLVRRSNVGISVTIQVTHGERGVPDSVLSRTHNRHATADTYEVTIPNVSTFYVGVSIDSPVCVKPGSYHGADDAHDAAISHTIRTLKRGASRIGQKR
jgi:hypothetical protein